MGVHDREIFDFWNANCSRISCVGFLATLARGLLSGPDRGARDSIFMLDTLEIWTNTLANYHSSSLIELTRASLCPRGPFEYTAHVQTQAVSFVRTHQVPHESILHAAEDGYLVAGCLAYALNNTGLTCQVLGRLDDAESCWKQAINLCVTSHDAIKQLTRLLCYQDRHRDALAFLLSVLPHNKNNLFLCHLLGDLQIACCFRQDAARTFAALALRICRGPLSFLGEDLTEEDPVLWLIARAAQLFEFCTSRGLSSCPNIAGVDQDPVSRSSHLYVVVNPQQALKCREYLGSFDCDSTVSRESSSSIAGSALQKLAKLLQEGKHKFVFLNGRIAKPSELFVLYALSLALNPGSSPANNAGTVLASMAFAEKNPALWCLAEQYYVYGLEQEPDNPHLYTNLGSLHRDRGDLNKAASMYQKAVLCDGKLSAALVHLSSTYKDQGRLILAANCYRRALAVDPSLVEAISGLSLCQGSICDWRGRGGCDSDVYVDNEGDLTHSTCPGWLSSLIQVVEDQVKAFEAWSKLGPATTLKNLERTLRAIQRQWYIDTLECRMKNKKEYDRPLLPDSLPQLPKCTVVPFHTFTLPLSSKHIQLVSQISSLHVSVPTLQNSWLPSHVYPPPSRPNPQLRLGYVSSDFADHPLGHLMQSVFGMHNRSRVLPIIYATTKTDMSSYRSKIETESYMVRDVSSWTTREIVEQIVRDDLHVLVNLNGFTRGARNGIFAARPCSVQISMMGFPGMLHAGWCDYILGDPISMGDCLEESQALGVHKEKIIYMPDSFFCCDHRQSQPEGGITNSFEDEMSLRTRLREQLFKSSIPSDAFIMANFNQLYKIDPSTFRIWIRILQRLPEAFLWFLEFPSLGKKNLQYFALRWTNDESVVRRIVFTPVIDKPEHILRARVCDLFIDTPECNAHTTAVDVLWSCSPIVTWPRYSYKMCSRIAAGIVFKAFPATMRGQALARHLVASSGAEYEQRIVELAGKPGLLKEMRQKLYNERFHGRLFDTARWVRQVKQGYWCAWNDYVEGRHENIYVG